MDTLSPELLEAVLVECEHATLKALRLVNSQFKLLTTPHVFRHVYMAFFNESLVKFNLLANSPLAVHVRKFTLFTDPLPSYDKLAYEAAVKRLDVAEDRIPAAYDAYKSLWSDQHSWRRELQGVILKQSLSMLDNLTEVDAIAQTSSTTDPSTWPVWKRIKERTFLLPDDWDKASDWRCRGVALWLLEAIAFRASFAGTRQVERLTLRINGLQTFKTLLEVWGGHQTPMAIVLPTTMQAITDSFEHLRHLELRHSPGVDTIRQWNFQGPLPVGISEFLQAEQIAHELAGFLQGAKRLTSLTTDGENMTTWARAVSSIASPNKIKDVFLPSLVTLNLVLRLPIANDNLMQFLALFASTISSLHFRGLLTEDAEGLLRAIPPALPQLKSIRVQGMKEITPDMSEAALRLPPWVIEDSDADRPYEKAIREYLLGRNDRLPDLKGLCRT